jgi:hypothetical protein
MSDDRPPSDDADGADVPERAVDPRPSDTDAPRPTDVEDPRPADVDDSRPADVDDSPPSGPDDYQPSDTGDHRPEDGEGHGSASGNDDGRPGGRDVEVPLRVYKAVTVFSTLFAVMAVVAGFVLLDTATQRATAAPGEADVALALVGLGSIALGAVVYAFSTRFRARGMGKPKDEAD